MKQRRKKRKLSRRAFARGSELTARRIARLETGKATLFLSDLAGLAAILNMHPWQIAQHIERFSKQRRAREKHS